MSAAFPGNTDSPIKFYVDSGVTLEIDNDDNYYDNYGTLIHDGGVFNNRGPTINHGNITNKSGKFKNLKSVENYSDISNNGDWINWGLVTNYKDATILSSGQWAEMKNAEINNYGTIRSKGDNITFHITSQSATINVKDSGRLINDQGSTMINDGNINIDKGARLVNKVMCIEFKNWGNIENYGTIYSYDRFENWDNSEYREDSQNSGNIDNYGTIVIGGDPEFAVFDNMGLVNMHGGVIEVQGGTFRNSGYLMGTGTYKGLDGDRFHNEPGGTFSPGHSAGGFKIEGDIYHSGIKQIEIGGPNDASRNILDTEYDFIDVAGDLIIDGGTLDVSLIDGYKLERNQEFIISKVDGEVTGTYSGLVEGALVGKFDSIYGQNMNLFITYEAGDGSDIGLYTTKSSLAPSPWIDEEPVIPAPKPESIQTDDGFTQFTDADDVLTNQSDIKYRLMGGDDYLEVIGGLNNFANGNMGEDTIILRGGTGEYLGGKDSDTFEVIDAEDGTLISANRGADIITGSVSGVIYRAGKDDDVIAVSQGKAWGDLGKDVFRGVTGEGYAEIQDYTIGEDVVELEMDGVWSNIDSGLMFTDTSGDQVMLLVGISDIKQVAMV